MVDADGSVLLCGFFLFIPDEACISFPESQPPKCFVASVFFFSNSCVCRGCCPAAPWFLSVVVVAQTKFSL